MVLLFLALLMSGCSNYVVSEKPWFSQADEAGAPRLKPGLWVAAQAGCRFDPRRPSERWPDCASAFVIRENEILHAQRYVSTSPGWREITYGWTSAEFLVAAGTPRLAQTTDCSQIERQVEPQPDGSMKRTDPFDYCYSALRQLRVDPNGFIIRAEIWPVLCGPWPTDEPKRESNVTDHPFPGIRIMKYDCVAESVAALREAGARSEAVAAQMGLRETVRWVREGYR